MPSLHPDFFDQTAESLAIALLGTILRRRVQTSKGPVWLAARIIETEAYYRDERGSHSSLGYTEKRRAMFMPPGTIYMYYARGGDSWNFSAAADGNAGGAAIEVVGEGGLGGLHDVAVEGAAAEGVFLADDDDQLAALDGVAGAVDGA